MYSPPINSEKAKEEWLRSVTISPLNKTTSPKSKRTRKTKKGRSSTPRHTRKRSPRLSNIVNYSGPLIPLPLVSPITPRGKTPKTNLL